MSNTNTKIEARKTRSRTGCFTCRRRKKKCDEQSYPICKNCSSKGLECEWPKAKHELKQLMKEVKYVAENKTKDSKFEIDKYKIQKTIKNSSEDEKLITSKPNSCKTTKKSHILERIALQQDIQEQEFAPDYGFEVDTSFLLKSTPNSIEAGDESSQFNPDDLFEFIEPGLMK